MNKQLKDYLPYLKDCIDNIDECRELNDEPNTLYVIKDERLSEFISTFYDLDIANGKYITYLEERNLDTQDKIDSSFNELSLQDLYAVLTMYIRSDRFVEGRLVSLAVKGILYKTVNRIVELSK